MIEIDREKCIGCGECEDACSFGAISLVDEVAYVDEDLCTMCGVCADVCPEEAISGAEASEEMKDISSWKGVWVAAETMHGEVSPVTFELLTKARDLAEKRKTEVTAVLMGSKVVDFAQELIAAGADRCIVVDHEMLSHFNDEIYANILSDLAKKEKPEIILAGATPKGRSYIPRVATMLETGLTADCTELDIREEDGSLLQTRPAWGGNLFATIVCPNHRPQMATVRPHVMKADSPDPDKKGEIVQVNPHAESLSSRVNVVEMVREKSEGPGLTDANVIITAGRGLEEEKNVELVKELAALLEGGVGATRAVTDAGWLSERSQIGQTGVTVAPKLYMACGVSGAIQHVVGMQGSEIVVSINKDREASIFDVSTYGIVGDVREILPLLIKRIKKEKGIK
jgi:electron transfer flavoprotein alpha subunit